MGRTVNAGEFLESGAEGSVVRIGGVQRHEALKVSVQFAQVRHDFLFHVLKIVLQRVLKGLKCGLCEMNMSEAFWCVFIE